MEFPNLDIEKSCHGIIAGIDEAGRGPWAGPVVASAVIITDIDNIPFGINDSKKLKRNAREELYHFIMKNCQVGIGSASVAEIDQINILQATMLAMQRAINNLPTRPDMALIDGNKTPKGLPCASLAVIKGDAKSLSIAAASIVAKVTRDRIMNELAKEYPQYGWEANSGYGVKKHQEALERYGVTEHHRKSYKPIMLRIQSA